MSQPVSPNTIPSTAKPCLLPAAAGRLKSEYGIETRYDRLYKMILNAELPAVQVAGRYQIDLVRAAEILSAA